MFVNGNFTVVTLLTKRITGSAIHSRPLYFVRSFIQKVLHAKMVKFLPPPPPSLSNFLVRLAPYPTKEDGILMDVPSVKNV